MIQLLPDTPQLLAFIGAGLALNLIPGQDMLYVIVQSGQGSRQRGLLSALAIGCGTLFHIAAVSLGLAGLLAAVPLAYGVLRIAGALYLIWLGVAMWRDGGHAAGMSASCTPAGNRAMFLQGMLTNLLNPKVALFFLALLPQFCDPARGSIGLQMAMLGLIFCINGTLVLLAVSLATNSARHMFGGSAAGQRWLQRIGGGILAILGLRLLLQRGQ